VTYGGFSIVTQQELREALQSQTAVEKHYRVREAAEIADVEDETILFCISSGDLIAVNMARNPNGQRPRWRIPESELAKFLLRRRTQAAVPEPKPTRKPRRDSGVVEFYK
jgi:hypothetical protein